MGLFTVKNYGGGSPGLMTLPGYIGGDTLRDLMLACIGAAIAFVITFAVTFVLYRDEKEEARVPAAAEADASEQISPVSEDQAASRTGMAVCAPVKGRLVPLSKVNDPTFAEGILGKGGGH